MEEQTEVESLQQEGSFSKDIKDFDHVLFMEEKCDFFLKCKL